jgi:hypothetical protein
VIGFTQVVPTEETGHSIAECPSGYHVVSGGYQTLGPKAKVFGNDTFGSSEVWAVLISNFGGVIGAEVTAIAFCAPVGKAVAASLHAHSAAQATVRKRISAAESTARAEHAAELTATKG